MPKSLQDWVDESKNPLDEAANALQDTMKKEAEEYWGVEKVFDLSSNQEVKDSRLCEGLSPEQVDNLLKTHERLTDMAKKVLDTQCKKDLQVITGEGFTKTNDIEEIHRRIVEQIKDPSILNTMLDQINLQMLKAEGINFDPKNLQQVGADIKEKIEQRANKIKEAGKINDPGQEVKTQEKVAGEEHQH